MGVILDTSILIASERNRFNLLAFLETLAEEHFVLSSITLSELLHGWERCDDASRKEKRGRYIEGVLARIPVATFGPGEARHHARIWAELERRGERIGAHDLIVAATALSLRFSLAILNTDEFQRVPGLDLVSTKPFVTR